jgi:hypothetical protein
LDRAGDYLGGLRAVDDARNYAAGDPKKRVYLDCCEASLNASDRLDVSRAKEVLPPESAALAHDHETAWLEASIRIACSERRWSDSVGLCSRLESLIEEQGERTNRKFLRWVQVRKKWSERKARKASVVEKKADPSAEPPPADAEAR